MSLKALAIKRLEAIAVNQTMNHEVNQADSDGQKNKRTLTQLDEQSELAKMMARYPALAPCPLRGGCWVYRGQVCKGCWKILHCPSWVSVSFKPSIKIPSGIPKLKAVIFDNCR